MVGEKEVFAGVGYLSGRSIVTWEGRKPYISDFRKEFPPVYSFGAGYVLKKKFRLGMSVAQHSYRESYYNDLAVAKETDYYDAVSLAIEAKVIYINKRLLQLYGAYGLGAIYVKGRHTFEGGAIYPKKNADVSLCFMPLGLRIGNTYGVYVEAGVGYKGVITGGCSYKFGKPRARTFG